MADNEPNPRPGPMRKTEPSAEMLQAMAAMRAERERQEAERPRLEAEGFEALQRLYVVATQDSGQCRYIARFLLGLYNGRRFPFDLTDLRAIDGGLFDDCMAVLRMDAQVTRKEVHQYFTDGGKRFEQLAKDWAVEDMETVRDDATRAAQPVGTPAPLHDGGFFQATLYTYGDAPGYRDVSVVARIGESGNTKVELKLSPEDSETLLLHIARVHGLAWNVADRGPLDVKTGERRPAWLDRPPASWAPF